MIRRLYVHNFRCLENFELSLSGNSSILLIGKNGAGKSTVGLALEILQRIARGVNRVGDLIKPKDVTQSHAAGPVRFEIEVELDNNVYSYSVAFEFPSGFRELRVLEEKLAVAGNPVYSREVSHVRLAKLGKEVEAKFGIDWHLVALPIVQHQSPNDPLFIFKRWLASVLILRPIPSAMRGESGHETLQPDIHVVNFGAWFSGLLASSPAAYSAIDEYLKQVMPDLVDIKNPMTGTELRSLHVQFSSPAGSVQFPFDDLSDGEKCFMIFALVIAANRSHGPLFCLWDEPENYLAPFEVGPSIIALRRAFNQRGQLLIASHNPEAIRRFSDENTLVLVRKSHLEPTIVRSLSDLRTSGQLRGDFVEALIRGDVGA